MKNLLEESLGIDEQIVCSNATVVTDKEGNVVGWVDNDKPGILFHDIDK